MTNKPVTESEVRQFIDDWFTKLDDHVPVEELLLLVADEELVIKCRKHPNTDIQDLSSGITMPLTPFLMKCIPSMR